jgi:hypothetical protein
MDSMNYFDSKFQLEIKVVTTEKALHFFDHKSLQIPVLREEDEWKGRGPGCWLLTTSITALT